MLVRDDAFYQAIQEDPDNDGPRLIYADWLDESGRESPAAFAEFIRVQVELARLPPQSNRAVELCSRQDALLDEWRDVWLGDLAKTFHDCTFRRGFLEAVHASSLDFLEHAPDWFERWPTLSVAKLTGSYHHIGTLAESPWLAHLRGLDLSDNELGAQEIKLLSDSRFIALLEAIDLSSNPFGSEGVNWLANAQFADELRELCLGDCGIGRINDLLGLRATQWRRIDLSNNHLRPSDAIRLAESEALGHVTALDFGGNPIGDIGTTALVQSHNAANLVSLGLASADVGDKGLIALAESTNLTSLRNLDVRSHTSRPVFDRQRLLQHWDGIGDLAASKLMGQLRRLLVCSDEGPMGWTDHVLTVGRSPRRSSVATDFWTTSWAVGRRSTIATDYHLATDMASELRKSRDLMPTRLDECDVAEIWWLGDAGRRQRWVHAEQAASKQYAIRSDWECWDDH